MQILGAILSWAVAAVLLCSGALKLARSSDFHRSMVSLRLPEPLIRDRAFARVFPYVELGLGALILLLPPGWVLVPLVAATALFAAFVIVVTRAVRFAEPASCNCFGGLGADQVGRSTVARNGVLLAVALLAVVLHTAPAAWASGRWGGVAYLSPALFATALAAGLVVYRNRREQRVRRRTITSLTVRNRAGEVLPITELQDPPSYVVFFSPGCGACSQAIEEFRWWPHALPDDHDLVPVLCGTPEQFEPFPQFAAMLDHAWYDPAMDFYRAVGGSGTPAGTLIDAQHPLGNGTVAGIPLLRELIWTPEFTARYRTESQVGGDERARQLARDALIEGGWDPAWLEHAEIVLTNETGQQVVLPPAGQEAADRLTP